MSGGEVETRQTSCCISHHFFRSASNNPTRIAVVHAAAGHRTDDHPSTSGDGASSPPLYPGDEWFTYADLTSAVSSLYRRLRHILDGGDDPHLLKPKGSNTSRPRCPSDANPQIVGLYMVPSVEYIVSVLSVLRCGEAFLPLDPSWPEERILSTISSSKASLVVRSGRRSDWIAERCTCLSLCFLMKDGSEEGFGWSELPWPCESARRRRFCYLMYTSGSTGRPKGVCGTEKGLLNRFWWMQEEFPVCINDVLLFKTSISFVDHLQEFLGSILTCTTLVIPDFDGFKANPFCLVGYLKVYRISRLTAVPSLMRVILPSLGNLDMVQIQWSLKVLVLSGEFLPISLWKMLHELLPETTILNLYGSTEVSGDCLYFNCNTLPKILETESPSTVPIGVPISNCEIDVVGGPATSAEGEIYVGGDCLMSGYFDETLCSFSAKDDGTPLHFRTGDFGKRLQSGELVFLGRKDRTVKINGQRVSLEEIESTLREHPEVSDAAVKFCRTSEGSSHLEAFFVLEKSQSSQKLQIDQEHLIKELVGSIRRWMSIKLPSAMIPTQYFHIELLPMSASGKINHALLESSAIMTKRRSEYQRDHPYDGYMQIIKEAFCDALKVNEISETDNFFLMGGNSVSAAHAAHRLSIDMRLLYMFPSPFNLLNALRDRKSSNEKFFARTSDSGKRIKLHDEVPISFDSSKINGQNNRLLGGIEGTEGGVCDLFVKSNPNQLMGQLERYNGSPSRIGPLKDGSYLPRGSYCAVSSYAGPWFRNIGFPITCSFSRSNQFMHDGKADLDHVCRACVSVEVQRYSKGSLEHRWQVLLNSCVDASPLVVLKDGDMYLFIGSHSHLFVCIDAFRGTVLWKVILEGRIECSAGITGDYFQVVVGCYKGKVYFLDFITGDISWTFQTNGEVKMQPVVDKLRDLIWCGSHDQWLYALDYRRHCCVYKISCGGSIFGSPCIDSVRNMIYVASTSGRVSGVSLEVLPFSLVWLYESGAPIFGSLTLDSSSGNVICCLVDGHVIALNSSGDVVWKASTDGPTFAGACLSSALPSQVLICSRNGSIYSFDMEVGALLWEYQTGDPITASAYVDELSCVISEPSDQCDRLACICSSSGTIHVLRISPSVAQEEVDKLGVSDRPMVQAFGTIDLPGAIFSSPVMIAGRIFVGCRDDNVHCVDIVTQRQDTLTPV